LLPQTLRFSYLDDQAAQSFFYIEERPDWRPVRYTPFSPDPEEAHHKKPVNTALVNQTTPERCF
jgi:hypothetical protein